MSTSTVLSNRTHSLLSYERETATQHRMDRRVLTHITAGSGGTHIAGRAAVGACCWRAHTHTEQPLG